MIVKSIVMATALTVGFSLPALASDVHFDRINATVPFSEGGGSDTLIRALTPYLSDALPGKPTILIRNEPGGGGIPSTNRFARSAKSDGTDIISMSSSLFIASTLKDRQIRFDIDDLTPVFIAPMAPILYVSPETGAKGPGDIEAVLDDELTFGGGRQNSADVLTVLMFDLLGVKIKSVWGLERGASRIGFERGEFTVDHQTTAAYANSVQPLVDQGKAIPLMASGIIDPHGKIVRDPNFPNIPTFLELYEEVHGKPLTGPAYDAYYGLTAAAITTGKVVTLPSSVSPEVLATYDKAFAKVVKNKDFRHTTEKFLGGYELYVGEDARALWGSVKPLNKEAYDWLAKWFKDKVNFNISR
ncbi:hypothetical protein ACJ3XJ_17325 [Marinomonas sp. RS-M-Aa-14]